MMPRTRPSIQEHGNRADRPFWYVNLYPFDATVAKGSAYYD